MEVTAMSDWHVDAGLAVLIKQMRQKYPRIVIGTIAGGGHTQTGTDHVPDPSDKADPEGVDAADFMLGDAFTKSEADKFVNSLVHFKDQRIAYIIWYRKIISATVEPWVWREYRGSNPHTDHPHLSVNDKHHSDLSTWDLNMEKNPKLITIPDVQVPDIGEGDRDDQLTGYNMITRIQFLKQITPDGIWGPETTKAVGAKRMTI